MNEPSSVMLALLVAFVLGFALCCLCVLLAGKRQESAREIELARELDRARTDYDELIHQQRAAEKPSTRYLTHS